MDRTWVVVNEHNEYYCVFGWTKHLDKALRLRPHRAQHVVRTLGNPERLPHPIPSYALFVGEAHSQLEAAA